MTVAAIRQMMRGAERAALVCAVGAAVCSCAPYYSSHITLPAAMPQAQTAVQHSAMNLADLALVQDAVSTPDSGMPAMRYVGLRSTTHLLYGVRAAPGIGILLRSQENGKTLLSVTSVGGDRLSDIYVAAVEQELAAEGAISMDTLGIPAGSMAHKSSIAHQALNLLNPGIGMGYVVYNNPYYTASDVWQPLAVGAADIGALALAIPAAKNVFAGTASRAQQYQFVIGLGVAALLRYIEGVNGYISLHEYNALADSPYYLTALFVNNRIARIGASVRLP